MPDLERIKKFKDRVADTATSVADSAQGTLQKTSEKVTDTASSVAGAVQDASQKASVQAADAAASVVWSAQDALAGASEKVTDTADTVRETVQKAPDVTTATAKQVTSGAKGALEATTGALQEASSKASVKATDAAASAVWSGQDALQDASEKVTDTAASTAGTVRETAQKAPDVAAATAKQVTSGAKGALEATSGAVHDAAHKAPHAAIAAVESVKTDPKAILEATASAANALLSTTQGLLASDLAGAANDLVQEMVKGVPTVYDKAMDANFIETGIGGSWHRLFDGGHTIGGAWNAAREALPDDNIIQEARGTIQGLLRDVSTPRGLPLATWDKETFDQVAGALESDFHIPQDWFRDLNTYDVPDLIGGTVGAVCHDLQLESALTLKPLPDLLAAWELSSALSANPLLLIVTVVALGQGFSESTPDRRVCRARGWST